MTVRAPAKINLELAVGALRGDGFHDVATAYHAVSLYDEVIVKPAERLSVSVAGAHGVTVEDVPRDGTNIAAAAAVALAERVGIEPAVHLHVTKGIPVAGGMAGGSADAAAALVACDALWDTGLSKTELAEIAAGLGSDVPFSLVGGTALGVGRGEVLTPVLARGRFQWVVAIADGGLSTPAVYAECDRLRDGAAVPEPGSATGSWPRCGPGTPTPWAWPCATTCRTPPAPCGPRCARPCRPAPGRVPSERWFRAAARPSSSSRTARSTRSTSPSP